MRKKSGRTAAAAFRNTLHQLEDFTQEIHSSQLTEQAVTWGYEAALIKTYVAFEKLMLECLVTAVNNDMSVFSDACGARFPDHLNDEACEWLITGGGYFNFRGGRSGLLKEIKKFVPKDHWLPITVEAISLKQPIDQLIALRDFAAHESRKGKVAAKAACRQNRMRSAGAWIKKQGRYPKLLQNLHVLADEIEKAAPF